MSNKICCLIQGMDVAIVLVSESVNLSDRIAKFSARQYFCVYGICVTSTAIIISTVIAEVSFS